MIVNVPLRRKDNEITTEKCNIFKTIELPYYTFQSFKNHLLNEYDFIAENARDMGTPSDGTSQAIMVLCGDSDDGILVESEGASYARYSAFVPGARTLLLMDRYPSLKRYAENMDRLVTQSAQLAVENQHDGEYKIDCDSVFKTDGFDYFDRKLFTDMLCERPEIDDFETDGSDIYLTVAAAYRQAEDLSQYRKLDEQAIEIMCAKHVLWLNDAGGEQANFSGCLLKGVDLSKKNLNSAIFDNARIMNCNFHRAELCFASMKNSIISGTDLGNVIAEEADFSHSVFSATELDRSLFTHSNFSGTSFQSCTMIDTSLQSCCTENCSFGDADLRSVNLNYTSDSENQWLIESGYEPKM